MMVRDEIMARGLRKDWVAQQMGISPSYLTRLLHGQRRWTPTLRTRMAQILGIAEHDLFLSSDGEGVDSPSAAMSVTGGGDGNVAPGR